MASQTSSRFTIARAAWIPNACRGIVVSRVGCQDYRDIFAPHSRKEGYNNTAELMISSKIKNVSSAPRESNLFSPITESPPYRQLVVEDASREARHFARKVASSVFYSASDSITRADNRISRCNCIKIACARVERSHRREPRS